VVYILEELKRRENIVRVIGGVLDKHGVQVSLKRMELHLGDKALTEILANKSRVSTAILNHMFSHEPAPAVLHHYTGLSGVQGIAGSGELRLYPIKNRLGQGGELEAFAKAHGLFGYLDTSSGSPVYKELSEDLFYISMTRVPPRDPFLMWGAFAKGTGARLQFRLRPGAAELRPIHYEQSGSVTLLRDINDALAAAGEPPFNPWTISKIGAFYLKSTVASEDEVRLLVKRHPGGIDLTQRDGASRYWPIPIGEPNSFCQLDLTEVHIAPGADRATIEAIFQNSRFANVPIVGP
jgi:hypothetical protein